MNIFSAEDIARIKRRLAQNPEIVEAILKKRAKVREKLIIQKSGLATWGHYFICPSCGVRLIYDYDCNDHFDCPNCGTHLEFDFDCDCDCCDGDCDCDDKE